MGELLHEDLVRRASLEGKQENRLPSLALGSLPHAGDVPHHLLGWNDVDIAIERIRSIGEEFLHHLHGDAHHVPLCGRETLDEGQPRLLVALDLPHRLLHLILGDGQGDPLLHLVGEFEPLLCELLKNTHPVTQLMYIALLGVGDALLIVIEALVGVSLHGHRLGNLPIDALLRIRQLLC